MGSIPAHVICILWMGILYHMVLSLNRKSALMSEGYFQCARIYESDSIWVLSKKYMKISAEYPLD